MIDGQAIYCSVTALDVLVSWRDARPQIREQQFPMMEPVPEDFCRGQRLRDHMPRHDFKKLHPQEQTCHGRGQWRKTGHIAS